MAAQILAHVDAWFVDQVFAPLERDEPRAAIARMWQAVDAYFRSGRRICVVGAFALDATRDRFAAPIRKYFGRWIEALRGALVRSGVDRAAAARLAEDSVLGIQGALVLARALDQDAVFARTIERLRRSMNAEMASVVGKAGGRTRSGRGRRRNRKRKGANVG